MQTKVCTKCGKELPATKEFFYVCNERNFCLRSRCKNCCAKQTKLYYQENKEKTLKQQKKYYMKNKNEVLERHRRWNENNLDYYRKYNKSPVGMARQKKYDKSEKGKIIQKKADKKRYKKDSLSRCMRVLMWRVLKRGKNGHHWEDLVGYTLDELKFHLESLFQEGMTWKNHGQFGWHIDHKIPISAFNITSYGCEGFKKCWALENLQPLWAEDNLKKSNSLDWAK